MSKIILAIVLLAAGGYVARRLWRWLSGGGESGCAYCSKECPFRKAEFTKPGPDREAGR